MDDSVTVGLLSLSIIAYWNDKKQHVQSAMMLCKTLSAERGLIIETTGCIPSGDDLTEQGTKKLFFVAVQ